VRTRRALLGLIAIVQFCNAATCPQTEASAATAPLAFPRDYAAHPTYEREWWSLSGRAATKDGRRFDFQASFFRYSLGRHEALFSAEYSILDARSGTMRSGQRSARNVVSMSRAARATIAVDDWQLASDAPRNPSQRRERIRIGAENGFSLTLRPQKPPAPSLAFEGYALTRLAATGSLRYDGVRYAVTGSAWLDHEYERLSSGSERIGWERFELQFRDGRDIELFASRERDGRFRLPSQPSGAPDLAATQTTYGTREPMEALLVDRAGRTHHISPDRVDLIVRANTQWHSPHDDATYPALWQLDVNDAPAIAIEPSTRDRELLPAPNGIAVWYGSVDLTEADPPGLPAGFGFVQLSGYRTPTPL
jgi:predicted secreted hydrolase